MRTRSPILGLILALVIISQVPQSLAQGTDLVSGPAPQIEWPTFKSALDRAADSGKIVLIDIFSPNCGWCRKLQTEVYTQTELQKFVFDHFEIGRLDIEVLDDTVAFRGHELSSAYLAAGLGATGTPTTIFLEPDGGYITRLGGFHPHDDFFDVLKFIGTEAFREMSFDEFMEQKSED